MRSIKFRAWDKKNKKFLKPYREQHIGNWVNKLSINMDGSLSFHEDDGFGGKSIGGESIEKRFEIMQYTGLKDKNGTGIYEGDIVEAMSEGLKGIFEIRWRQDGSPCWILYPAWQGNEMWHIASQKHSDGNYYDKLKVIGNIYENPELLGDNQ